MEEKFYVRYYRVFYEMGFIVEKVIFPYDFTSGHGYSYLETKHPNNKKIELVKVNERHKYTKDQIVESVLNILPYVHKDLLFQRRRGTYDVNKVRKLCYYFMYIDKYTQNEIAFYFNRINHATVSYGYHDVLGKMGIYQDEKELVETIVKELAKTRILFEADETEKIL